MTARNTYFDNLAELIDLPLFVGKSKNDLTEETANNTCAISIDVETANSCTIDDFASFINKIENNRKAQLQPNQHMLFYVWLDEMAGQLRFSLLSAVHERPPFGAELKFVELKEIVKDFLTCVNMIGIHEENFEEGEHTETIADEGPFVQKVYSTII